MAIHDGHRERLRDCFRKDGLAGFDAIRSLELLLQYAIPRRDVNPIAHALLERFGSLQEVFDASEQELLQVEGVGPTAAVLIRLIPQLARKSAVDRAASMRAILSTADARDYLMPHFLYERNELAMLLCLDSQKRVIKCEELSRGVVNSVNIDVRRVLEIALKQRSCSLILAHNHPDGPAANSREDDAVTRQVLLALRTVGIQLQDHLIFARDGVFSYRDSGALQICEYL
jgi:DNA repair protein RadC